MPICNCTYKLISSFFFFTKTIPLERNSVKDSELGGQYKSLVKYIDLRIADVDRAVDI